MDSHELYFKELQAKSHNLACCFVRMKYNDPNHPDKDIREEKSIFWHNCHSNIKYMESSIDNTFKVFEASGSFTSKYEL